MELPLGELLTYYLLSSLLMIVFGFGMGVFWMKPKKENYLKLVDLVYELTEMLCHVEFANGDLGEETEAYKKAMNVIMKFKGE